MTPKKALIILSIITVVLIAGFYFFYQTNKIGKPDAGLNNGSALEREKPEIKKEEVKELVDKKNNDQKLTVEEEIKLDQIVEEKVEEKAAEIQNSAEERSYTQNEIDFIANPDQTVEKELGIKEPVKPLTAPKPLTQEEIDMIANPKR